MSLESLRTSPPAVVSPSLTTWRARWEAAGFTSIPLRMHSKVPLCAEWQHRPSDDQWQEAGSDFAGNIGVVTNPSRIVIDADEWKAPGTIGRISLGLSGLGIDPPRDITPRGGQHFYLALDPATVPEDVQGFYKLPTAIGGGEMRVRHNVAVPCSYVVDTRLGIDGAYTFIHGDIEQIPQQRPLTWRDVLWLLPQESPRSAANETQHFTGDIQAPPIRLIWREKGLKAKQLFEELRSAPAGQEILCQYESRHEAESAVVTLLILAGWPRDEIFFEFQRQAPGHFASHASPKHYFDETYRGALSELCADPIRQQVIMAARNIDNTPWRPRTGRLDRASWMTVLAKCWQFKTTTPSLGEREVCQSTGAGQHGANASLRRLAEYYGFMTLIQKGKFPHASVFDASLGINASFTTEPQRILVPPIVPVACGSLVNGADIPGYAELQSSKGLGRSGVAVYEALGEAAADLKAIAKNAGLGRSAAFYALVGRKGRRGLESFGLAERDGNGWKKGKRELADVARELECKRLAIQRREDYRKQREDRQRIEEHTERRRQAMAGPSCEAT